LVNRRKSFQQKGFKCDNLTDSVRIINNERIREINNIYSHPRVYEVNRSRRMLPKNSEKLTTNLQENLETLNISDG